jgi:hypothetical protein
MHLPSHSHPGYTARTPPSLASCTQVGSTLCGPASTTSGLSVYKAHMTFCSLDEPLLLLLQRSHFGTLLSNASTRFLDRPLQHINKKGRPVSQCNHCRTMRKSRSAHIKCDCGEKTSKCAHLQQPVDGHKGELIPWAGAGRPILPYALPSWAILTKYLRDLLLQPWRALHVRP